MGGLKLIRPTELDFGTIEVGKSLTLRFDFINIEKATTEAVEIYGIVSSDPQFLVVNPVSNFCLLPRETRTFKIRFSPRTSGNFSGSIQITHTDRSGKTTTSYVNVTGTGTGLAEIVPSPSSLDFGRVTVGKSADQGFNLKNTGANSNIVQEIKSSDPAFQIISPALPKKLGAGGSFEVDVRFSPTSVRSYSSTISIMNASGKVAATVRASGMGVGIPNISVSPSQLDFGQFDLGTFNERALNISNTGTADLIVQSFVFSDPHLKTVPAAPLTIAPSRSMQVKIRFRSSKLGPQTAVLTVGSNDQDEPRVKVTLQASAVAGKVGFVERSVSTRIDANTIRTRGVQWVDYNDDGKLDLYLCGSQGNGLFKNLGNGVFGNVTASARVGNDGKDCQGASWADMDNDGDLDLLIVNSSGPPLVLRNNRGIFFNAGSGLGTASASAGPSPSGGILFDFNNDGRIDMFVVKNGSSNQLFRATGLF
ncbi:MAG TPA: choice-of-anchor D domain-containing protein, partial [Acidobacteriota bacterium]|nr:choice-of-anchor D domain-containing protein [Acidobacteriota bacterium]